MSPSVVFMGAAGCGKSTLAATVAQALAMTLVEGDDFHSAASRGKMRHGIALDDQDRDTWLDQLCVRLREAPNGIILTCSALKRSYRERLRAASPALLFVFLDIPLDLARARVSARTAHFFSASLVDSQFAILEPPVGEPGVLRLCAASQIDELTENVTQWLRKSTGSADAQFSN